MGEEGQERMGWVGRYTGRLGRLAGWGPGDGRGRGRRMGKVGGLGRGGWTRWAG